MTDYEEDDIYVNGVLYQTSHDEGRIVNGVYEYNITDHNNDLRVAFRDSLGIAVPTQSIFYDPWGLSMKGMQITRNPLNFNKYQFLNRETQFETGYIDLINRQFDPQTGRFVSIDPVTDGQEHLSLYQYGWNNPVLKSDPNGLFPGEGLWKKFTSWLSTTPSKANKEVGKIYSATAYNGIKRTPQTNGQLVFDGLASGMQIIGQEHRGGLGLVRGVLRSRQKPTVKPRTETSTTPTQTPAPTNTPTPNPSTGEGYGVNDPQVRLYGPWTQADLKNALFGAAPSSFGKIELHHAEQMPGSGVHEIPQSLHRGNSALHPNTYNQGVTTEIRNTDRQFHWWYRAREMGAEEVHPPYIYKKPD